MSNLRTTEITLILSAPALQEPCQMPEQEIWHLAFVWEKEVWCTTRSQDCQRYTNLLPE